MTEALRLQACPADCQGCYCGSFIVRAFSKSDPYLAQLHAFVVEGGKGPECLAKYCRLRVSSESACLFDPVVNLCLVGRHGYLDDSCDLHLDFCKDLTDSRLLSSPREGAYSVYTAKQVGALIIQHM